MSPYQENIKSIEAQLPMKFTIGKAFGIRGNTTPPQSLAKNQL
jgi:hypothetical protein